MNVYSKTFNRALIAFLTLDCERKDRVMAALGCGDLYDSGETKDVLEFILRFLEADDSVLIDVFVSETNKLKGAKAS